MPLFVLMLRPGRFGDPRPLSCAVTGMDMHSDPQYAIGSDVNALIDGDSSVSSESGDDTLATADAAPPIDERSTASSGPDIVQRRRGCLRSA